MIEQLNYCLFVLLVTLSSLAANMANGASAKSTVSGHVTVNAPGPLCKLQENACGVQLDTVVNSYPIGSESFTFSARRMEISCGDVKLKYVFTNFKADVSCPDGSDPCKGMAVIARKTVPHPEAGPANPVITEGDSSGTCGKDRADVFSKFHNYGFQDPNDTQHENMVGSAVSRYCNCEFNRTQNDHNGKLINPELNQCSGVGNQLASGNLDGLTVDGSGAPQYGTCTCPAGQTYDSESNTCLYPYLVKEETNTNAPEIEETPALPAAPTFGPVEPAIEEVPALPKPRKLPRRLSR